jgi:hypothetical protein
MGVAFWLCEAPVCVFRYWSDGWSVSVCVYDLHGAFFFTRNVFVGMVGIVDFGFVSKGLVVM